MLFRSVKTNAAITAALLWIFGFGWEMQALVFTLVSILAVIAWHQYDKTRDKTSSRPNLNKRGHQYIGRTFQLSHAIQNGVGKINVDDSTWKVRGEDAPVNTKVKVTGINGTELIVEKFGV